MFQRAVFGLVKPFLLEQSWNKPGTKPTQTIVYLMNNMNKLFLACGRIGLSFVKTAFVPAVLFQGRFPKQEGPAGKTPFTYTPNRGKSCTPTCNREQRKSEEISPLFLYAFLGRRHSPRLRGLVADWASDYASSARLSFASAAAITCS